MGFVYYVLGLVLSLAALCAFIWVTMEFPFLGAAIKLLWLVVWGLVSTALPLYAIVAWHIPRGNYGEAAWTLFFGAFLTLFWVLIGWPALRGMFTGDADWRLRRPAGE